MAAKALGQVNLPDLFAENERQPLWQCGMGQHTLVGINRRADVGNVTFNIVSGLA